MALVNLSPNARYKVILRGGLNGIRSNQELWEPVYRGRYFDGNGNGVAEASDDLKPCYIQTLATGVISSIPPLVAQADVVANNMTAATNRYWTVVFHTTPASVAMNAGTLNGSNIQIAIGPNQTFGKTAITTVIQPKLITYDITTNTATVYLPDNVKSTSAWTKLLLGRNIQDANGLYFDGNGDGVGGNAPDDDRLCGNNSLTNGVSVQF
jgi:hypothetical protein